MVVGPAPHHGGLVGVRQAVGETAALSDDAVGAHFERHGPVLEPEWKLASERPDRKAPTDAGVPVGGDAVAHPLAFAEQVAAGLDLTEAPDRPLLVTARLIRDVRDRMAGPGAPADLPLLAQCPMPLLHAAAK